MSANANKKPPTPGTAAAKRAPLNSTPSTGAPSRSPSRMNSANGTTPSINRTKSVRSSTPAAAKAAARKGSTTPSASGDNDEARAEMQAQLSELQERLDEATAATTEAERQKTVLQTRLDEASKEQLGLEEQHSEHLEQIEELQREKKEALRHQREMEQVYETERAAGLREQEEREGREEELKTSLQRMKEALAQREMRAGLGEGAEDKARPSVSRNSSWRQSVSGSPNPGGMGGGGDGGQFAPPRPEGLQRSDSRSSSKIVMQKDKIIEGLRLDLAEAEFKLVEVENMGGGRLQELQKTVLETKMQNARLMEENESFQLLLQEKTLNGDFSLGGGSLLRPASNAGSRPSSRHHTAGGTTLADELESQVDDSELLMESSSGGASETDKRLQSEIHSLKEQNKALTLYINNIVSRLLQHDQFEHILDKTPDLMSGRPSSSTSTTAAPSKPPAAKTRPSNLTALSSSGDKDLPPPPPESPALPPPTVPEKDSPHQPQGFLQRAKSVIVANKPRPRPLSQAITPSPQTTPNLAATEPPQTQPRPTENPDTAPTIPLGRNNRNSTHRRAQSEWSAAGAASLVNNMYRGPGVGSGPLSPGLTSPGVASQRGSFFSPGNRTVSAGTSGGVPGRISEDENLQPAAASSNSNSNAHNAALAALDPGSQTEPGAAFSEGLSAPSSPPRSTVSSSGESGQRDRANNPVMMGSKMRPLRLVQEAHEEGERERKAANRGSWFGWMGKGAGPGQGVGGRSVSGNGEGS